MLFPEEDAPILKAWIVKRLENTSDADADVLADYVLALLRHDGSMEEVRKLCEEEIPDFLKEDSSVFVSDVFDAINYKSYLPGAAPPPKRGAATAAAAQPPTALPYDDVPMVGAPAALGPSQNGSRKRSYNDRGEGDGQSGREFSSGFGGGRPLKQPRRGGRGGGRGGHDTGFGRGAPTGPMFPGGGYQAPQFPAAGPSGSPVFDPDNPMEALLKMQSMGLPMPPIPNFGSQGRQAHTGQQRKRRQRCRDYDTKGYCARGNTCMFEHGTDSIFVPPIMPLPQGQGNEEYDPSNASIMAGNFAAPGQQRQNQQFNRNGKGHMGGQRDGQGQSRRRAPFSAEGPVNDKSKSTIVVENIPEERFNEEEVRGFFAQFGNIVSVSMQPYKRLAIVKFDAWSAANAAYRSPKVIFDNRFVKVFWYKEDESGIPSSVPMNKSAAGRNQNGGSAGGAGSPSGEPEIDMEEFARKQEEAQKAHNEKTQKVQELERQREELEKRQKDLIAKQQEEKQKLLAKLAASTQKPTGEGNSAGGGGGDQDGGDAGAPKPPSQTDALRAQLAALEAEAKQLGLDPEAAEDGTTWPARGGRGRGRGGYRARGFAPRGARGGYMGRGGGGQHAAYAAYSLDNRPRKVSVTGVDFTVPEKDETLRQHLFGIGEFTDIQTTPASTQITFKDRKTAEKFFFGISNKEIPGVEGKVELGWVSGGPVVPATSAPSSNGGAGAGEAQKQKPKNEDTMMTGGGGSDRDAATASVDHGHHEQSEMDYDVADDSQWE